MNAALLRRHLLRACAGAVLFLPWGGCSRPAPPAPTEVVAMPVAAIPADPTDGAWQKAPEYVASLIPQDLVEPRLLQPSTTAVRVRALTDGKTVAFRLQWDDPTRDDVPAAARFPDACAVQVPAAPGPTLPAPQMGEPGKPVEITFWSAVQQARGEGKLDGIHAIYPDAAIGHYPFEAPSLARGSAAQVEMADRYAPARATRNPVAVANRDAVQELVAEGPGTLRPARTPGGARGRGAHTGKGWAVVLSRPLPAGLAPRSPTAVAFAVWEGGRQEVGARKMRSAWTTLSLRAAP